MGPEVPDKAGCMGWGQIPKDSEDKVGEWVTLLEVSGRLSR